MASSFSDHEYPRVFDALDDHVLVRRDSRTSIAFDLGTEKTKQGIVGKVEITNDREAVLRTTIPEFVAVPRIEKVWRS